ncbi:ferric reductase-like transmembrane domain-containing protein [Aliiroseovarius sp. 2305UL8-7]|uniref:ferredoxin reductase family protein n=1 Tax=Aliiroseovarius conchicola TaxID=3121637 RepID=UPI0035278488
MLRKQGPLIIFAIIAIFIAVHFGLAGPSFDPSVAGPAMLGGAAYLLMTCSIFLATRAAFLEDLFGGLDRMYQVHKFCGIFALLLILPHFFLAPKDLPEGTDAVVNSLTPSAPAGMLAMILLILSLVIALNRKISYSRWRPMHKAMGLVYILATVHFFTIPEVFANTFGPSLPILYLAGAIGIVSFFYSIFGMNKRTALEYRLDEVNGLERATELVLSPVSTPMSYKAGQFAFIEIEGKDWNEPHPFTISSSPGEDKLRFTLKVLGDWTRKVREELEPGAKVLVRGPYGRFDTTKARDKQIWLAGGIGLTPFLSSLRDMKQDDSRDIHLVYAAREENDAIYLDELKALAAKLGNITLVPLFSDEGNFARVDIMKEKLPDPLDSYDYFMCGPKPMIDGLMKGLKSEGVARNNIHTEAFEFR